MYRFALVLTLLFVSSALHAQTTLRVEISDPTVFTDFNGAGAEQVDLMYEFIFDSGDVMTGQGMDNGDLYSGLSYTVTSTALGLDRVAAVNLLDFELNPDTPLGASNDGFLLYTTGTPSVNGVSGFGGLLGNWDGMSSLSVTGGSGPATGGFSGLQTTLIDGSTLDGSSFNFNDTTVSIFAVAVPEPSSAIAILGLASACLCRRRRTVC